MQRIESGAVAAFPGLALHGSGSIRRLAPADRQAVLEHFRALTPDDHEMRFGCALSPEAIVRYVSGLNFARDILLGLEHAEGTLIGLAEILRLAVHAAEAEVAFSILPAARGRGLGHFLMMAANSHARASGLRRLRAYVRPGNKAMLTIFARAGMELQRDGDEVLGLLHLVAEPKLTVA